MKASLMFSLLLLSIFLYEAQGIRLKDLSISASNNQVEISNTKSSWNSKDDGSAVTSSVVSSGINRKLMTKTISSSPTTMNEKNDQKANQSFAHEAVTKEGISPTRLVPKNSKHEKIEVSSELSPDAINDIAGMDYSPAKRKPPIHN